MFKQLNFVAKSRNMDFGAASSFVTKSQGGFNKKRLTISFFALSFHSIPKSTFESNSQRQ